MEREVSRGRLPYAQDETPAGARIARGLDIADTVTGGHLRHSAPGALFALMVLLTGVATAHAQPPPVGSEDWLLMQPFADVIRVLHMNGVWCCDWSDGRPVDAQRGGNSATGWQVRFHPGNDIGAPADRWIDVPVTAVDPDAPRNPVGVPIAWWYGGGIRCFWPGFEN